MGVFLYLLEIQHGVLARRQQVELEVFARRAYLLQHVG